MNFKKSWGLGALAVAMTFAMPAFAQVVDIDDYDDYERGGITRDLNVTVRGGLNSFTGDLGANTGTGAFVGVQADSRPLDLVGVELGYEGSRNPFEDINGGLWRHNVGALAKVGPQLGQDGDLRPFVGAGFGVSVLNPSDDAELFFDNDVVSELPLAAGFEYRFNTVTAGARATYRLVGGEDLGLAQNGNIFNVGLQLGGNF